MHFPFLFTDDTVLFFEASRAQAENVKAALDLYGEATRQSLDYNKCSLFFGAACPVVIQDQVQDAMNVTSLVFEERYLGLPTSEGRMSNERFQKLQASLTKRLIQ